MTETNRNTPPSNALAPDSLKLERLTVFLAEAEQLQVAGVLPINLMRQIQSAIIAGREPSRLALLAWDEIVHRTAGV